MGKRSELGNEVESQLNSTLYFREKKDILISICYDLSSNDILCFLFFPDIRCFQK